MFQWQANNHITNQITHSSQSASTRNTAEIGQNLTYLILRCVIITKVHEETDLLQLLLLHGRGAVLLDGRPGHLLAADIWDARDQLIRFFLVHVISYHNS